METSPEIHYTSMERDNSEVRDTGSMFLHGDGSFVTYLTFFMSLRGILDANVHATEVKALDGIW